MQNLIFHLQHSKNSIDKVSKKSKIPVERLQSIIENKSVASLSEVRRLSAVFDKSVSFLLSENDKFDEINVLFRDAIGERNADFFSGQFSYFIGNSIDLLEGENLLELFQKTFPRVENNLEGAEYLSSLFRLKFFNNDQVSPILNLPEILSQELRIIVHIKELGNSVDGASAIVQGIPFIFVSPRHSTRMLFTLAHELGHILSHHLESGNYAKFDKEIKLNLTDKSRKKEEFFSNAFASALLLPKAGVGITLKKIRERRNILDDNIGDAEILLLSRIYGVSFEVAGRRCEDLGLFPKGSTHSLYSEIKKDYGSPEKRADELGLPKRPAVNFPKVSRHLVDSAINKISKGQLSIGKASEILSIPVRDLMFHNAPYNA
ncbi:ImmA/IrrE family metallo-endopeptidase [Ekhidna sp.]|uniref:ImmA/IrrE family metallo-endopeptidase n=1 Tax=Ekhidna sp. TaxID=2608089 RepID=UPI003B5B0881